MVLIITHFLNTSMNISHQSRTCLLQYKRLQYEGNVTIIFNFPYTSAYLFNINENLLSSLICSFMNLIGILSICLTKNNHTVTVSIKCK